LQHSVDSFVSVTEAEPDSLLFEIPTGYAERSPSAAMAEAFRRFPKESGFNCGPVNQRVISPIFTLNSFILDSETPAGRLRQGRGDRPIRL